jgi:hypothetical protein
MFFPKVEFNVVVAFIDGFNLACYGGLLVGFHQWLVATLGHGNNRPWDALVLELTFPKARIPNDELAKPGNQKVAVDALFELLETFMQERQSPEGLRRIFVRYEAWLKRQEWYVPSSPQWLPPDNDLGGASQEKGCESQS